MIKNNKGQAQLEAIVAMPVMIAFLILFLGFLFVGGAVALLRDRLDEALICMTYQPRDLCEKRLDQFFKRTGFDRVRIQTNFLQQGPLWIATTSIKKPGGGSFRIMHTLRTPLSENFR